MRKQHPKQFYYTLRACKYGGNLKKIVDRYFNGKFINFGKYLAKLLGNKIIDSDCKLTAKGNQIFNQYKTK